MKTTIKRHVSIEQVPSAFHTEIHFGHELLYNESCTKHLSSLNRRLVLISDSHVKSILADKWASFLKKQGIDLIHLSFPAGEGSKSREMKAQLEDELFHHKCGKDTAIIAMGGGVTTDLSGFLASTFCRGVPLILVPTTLLGMVDAVIGGKTGVNTPFGKNLVGTYYPAGHIFIDTTTLTTLPEKEWRNGLAEILKHGLIRSPLLFDKLITHQDKWAARDPEFLQEVIYDSFLIKKEVVEADFQENGYRRTLNFGHTIAHAIENLENYQISHGEAVAIGMLVEGMLSHRLGYLTKPQWEQIEQAVKMFAFPLQISPSITFEALVAAMTLDKKAKNAKPRFVLLESIGSTVPFDGAFCTQVEDALLHEVLIWMLSYLRGTQ